MVIIYYEDLQIIMVEREGSFALVESKTLPFKN